MARPPAGSQLGGFAVRGLDPGPGRGRAARLGERIAPGPRPDRMPHHVFILHVSEEGRAVSNERIPGPRRANRTDTPVRPGRRSRASGHTRRPDVESLEGRLLLALLGISQQLTKPDIASGSNNSLSYVQVGNNA